MRIVKPSAVLLHPVCASRGPDILKRVEQAGRVCYKSEGRVSDKSFSVFLSKIITSGHESVLEHGSATVRFVVDRGVSHEIVRHRIASYSQESTRYCNYAKTRFGSEVAFIDPRPHLEGLDYSHWVDAMEVAEINYFKLLDAGVKPQMARAVLPNSLKTEIVMTANLREWRHFFGLRTAPAAHPQMRQVAIPLLLAMRETFPGIFEGIKEPAS